EVRVFRTEALDDPSEDGAIEEATPEEGASPLSSERVPPLVAKARDAARAAADKAKPALAALFAKLALLCAKALERGGPRAKAAWARVRSGGAALFAKLAARVMRGRGKRRTTAAPVRVAQAPKLRRQREERAAPPRKTGRIVVLSTLAIAAVASAV